MIALASNYLLFELEGGETIPFSAENMSIEVSGDSAALFDSEFVRHAAKAVFHYFKFELERQTVSIEEFSGALEKVLSGFALHPLRDGAHLPAPGILESDLRPLAEASGTLSELFFFPRLREELRRQLSHAPRIIRFSGLRGCVKRLAGARRWSGRCRRLEEQIIEYLRQCLTAEPKKMELALVVD